MMWNSSGGEFKNKALVLYTMYATENKIPELFAMTLVYISEIVF